MMGGSRGDAPADPIAPLRQLVEVLRPILNEPALAAQLRELRSMLDELTTREAAVKAREHALVEREARIDRALAALVAV